MSLCHVYAHEDGVIQFGDDTPRGAMPIIVGDEPAVRAAIEAVAHRGNEPGVLLVPGMSAETAEEKNLLALVNFHTAVCTKYLQVP